MAKRSKSRTGAGDRKNKSLIVVLGMHRSGTSALTRVLNLGGAELPDDLTRPIPGNNEKGFFESHQLLAINIRILNALNIEWWSPAPIDSGRLGATDLKENRRQIDDYLAGNTSERSTFLMKDPRMCRLFPLWKKAIRRQGHGLGVVLALRNPLAVAESLLKRDGLPVEHGWLLWLRYMLEAERHTRGVRRTVVAYESLLEDWEAVAYRIARTLKAVWVPDWSGSKENISRFLEDRLNHFDKRFTDVDMPTLVGEAYSVFQEMETGSILDRSARSRLDDINSEINKVDKLVGASLDYTSRQYFQINRELKGKRQVSEKFDAFKADLENKLEGIEKEFGKHLEAVRQNGALEAELHQLRGQYQDALKSSLNAREESDREIQDRLEESRKSGELEAEFRRMKAYAEKVQADRDQIQGELSAVREAMSALEKQHEGTQRELDDARSERDEKDDEVQRMKLEFEQLQADRDQIQGELSAVREAMSALEKQHEGTQLALERARVRISEKTAELREVASERDLLIQGAEDASAQRSELDRSLRTERAERERVEREYESVSKTYLLAQRQREVAIKQLVVTRTALKEEKSSANEELKSRVNIAEQALRHEMFNHLPVVAGCFNIWIRPQNDLERNAGTDLGGAGFDFINPERWRNPSRSDISNCARELVRRGLFDLDYYKSHSGVSSMGRRNLARRFLAGEWRHRVHPSPLFDGEYYSQQAFGTSLEDAPGCPLLHYVLLGARKGIAPHPLFDPEWYRSQLPAGMRDIVDPLSHYLNCGWRHNLDPHWSFNVHWYRYWNDDVRKVGVEPLAHFLSHGDNEGRSPHPFFDTGWYRRGLGPDAGNTLLHFFSEGMESGRSTHPLIDADYLKSHLGRGVNWFRALVDGRGDVRPNHLFSYVQYLHLNCDVETNPFVHYIEFGWKERRRPHILFDPAHYALENNLSADEDPLAHYLLCESCSRPSAHPMFDDAFYRKQNPDLCGSEYGLFDHFVFHGGREGRSPSSEFDSRHYMSQVQLPEGWNPLEHYLLLGKRLGLSPTLNSDAQSIAGWTWIRGGVQSEGSRPAVLLVAHVATGNLFGSERSFLDMVQGLHGTDLVDVIVTLPQEETGYVARIAPFVTGIYVRSYPWWDASKAPDEGTVDAFERLLNREDRVRAVHVNTMMVREPLIAARNCGCKAVVHVREILDCDQHLQNRLGLTWEEAVAEAHQLADYFICNSAATQRLFPERSFVVPNTIEVRQFETEVVRTERTLSEEEKRPDLVYVGMISSNLEKKGIGDFIQLAHLTSLSSPLRFVLIGPRSADLDAYLASGAPDNLICTGYIEEAAEAIARLDVIVSFSHFAESFGRTVLEAMAAGKPVVVYDYGALPYLVEEGESGYIVPYRNFKSALPLLQDLAENPTLRDRLGRRGHEIAVSEYDTHCYVNRMWESYKIILEDPAEVAERPNNRRNGSSSSVSSEVTEIPPQSEVKLEASALEKHEISAARVMPARFERNEWESPLRIAYFQWHFPVPSETFVLNELRGLVAEGYDVTVFCRQSPYPDFKPDFPISWSRIDTPGDLAEALERSGRNIVHSHFTYPTVTEMVWPACQRSGAKFTFCAHAQDIFKYENDEKNRIGEVVSSRECLAVFVPGRFHFDYLTERGVPAEKIVINPQGIDTSLYPPLDRRHVARSNRRLTALHRFTEKKGLEYAIHAAPRLAELGVEIELWGYGDDADSYRDLIRETGADNVTVHEGVIGREEMIQVFERSDLFLAPSVRAESGDMDGIPTVVMEAMMCGLPVLTTNVSSLSELVMDEHTGMVCKPRDADSLAEAVERFYSMPDVAVDRMIETAEAHVRDRFDVTRVVRMAKRVWEQARLDVVIVTWNNLPELQEVVTRLYRHTHFPFHLLICDNDSEKEVTDWLEGLHAEHDNITLIHKGRNSFVGPGTNTAAAFGDGDFVVYICGKEGFITQPCWDSAVVNYMTENPEVGLAGTLCYSPTYLRRRDYPEGIREWSNFRNQSFALENPDRIFSHVQGGFFAMRRTMLDEIGGFNDDVPHSYTDVEFSYYVESCGWKLGEMSHILALFNKTRPNIEARYEEFVYAVHPPMMGDREWMDAVAARKVRACNLCKTTWGREGDRHRCSGCGATSMDRTLYRALAESHLMYRRLPALATDLDGKMAEIWQKSFQGSIHSSAKILRAISAASSGGIEHNDHALNMIYFRGMADNDIMHDRLIQELWRVLSTDGEVWLQLASDCGCDNSSPRRRERVVDAFNEKGFALLARKRYSSTVVDFSAQDLLCFGKSCTEHLTVHD